MSEYTYTGPVDCTTEIDTSNLKGKVAIVTGGANGIGEAYVRGLVSSGALVCIGDLNTEQGVKLIEELGSSSVHFVKCNVTNWEDQVSLFNQAKALSPSGEISYVVANAGITKADSVFNVDEPTPSKPDLQILDVNLTGSLYATKLALWHFLKQNGPTPSPSQHDTCLVLIGSGAAYCDVPRTPQYMASKFALRGVLHALRRTAFYHGSRINMIAPWYIKSNILSESQFEQVRSTGVEFGTVEDAQACLLRILSDTRITGKSFMVGPRKWARLGHWDLELDDFPANPDRGFMEQVQQEQMWSVPVSLGLFASAYGRGS